MITGVGYRAWFSVGWVVITDLKMWLFARSEEGNNIKKYMYRLGKSFHITNCKTFFNF
jgi:hypothetical protein